MPLSRYVTHLANAAKTKALLNKIELLFSQKASRVVFEIGSERFNAADCTNVVIDGDAVNNNIIFTRPSGPTLKASLVVQDLTYTAVAAGAAGNSISIAYLDTGTAGAEVASVVGTAISVSMEAGVSTANQIRAAILASAPASALVVAVLTGTNVAQAAASLANLAGGADDEQYDTADILGIRRLRVKKYLIHLKAGSDPVEA